MNDKPIYAVIWQDFGTLLSLPCANGAEARNKAHAMREKMKKQAFDTTADTVHAVCVPAGENKLQYLD